MSARPAPTVPETPETPHASTPGGALRLEGGVGAGVLPNLDGGVALSGAVLWRYARLELRGAYWGGGTVEIEAEADARARFSLLSATVRGCGVPPAARRFEFPICLGVEAGAVLGQIAELRFLHAPHQPWVGIHLASTVAWVPVPRFALVATVEPWVAAVHARHVAIAGEVHRGGIVGIRGYFGAEVRFGRGR